MSSLPHKGCSSSSYCREQLSKYWVLRRIFGLFKTQTSPEKTQNICDQIICMSDIYTSLKIQSVRPADTYQEALDEEDHHNRNKKHIF